MTSQQIADELLAEHQAARRRAEALLEFYQGERRAGVDPLTANERMHEHAKHLDAIYAGQLQAIATEMERT